MAKESYPRRPERDLWPCLYFFPVKTLLPFAAIALLLPLGACGGSLSIGGPLWIFGDGGDDDDSAGVGDDDDASDDDDTTPPSGPVVCGPTVQPGSSWEGTSTEVYTGDAVLTFEYEERGGLFSADWSGCEAKHFFGPDGESECGILWSAEGTSYGEQVQPSGLVSRFRMEFLVEESSCGLAHHDAEDYELFFRVSLTEGDDGLISITWSEASNTQPANMEPWTTLEWDGKEQPDEVAFDYFTDFVASGK